MRLVKGRRFRPVKLLVLLPLTFPYFLGYVPVWKLGLPDFEAPASWWMQWLHGLLLCALVALAALALIVVWFLAHGTYDYLFEREEK